MNKGDHIIYYPTHSSYKHLNLEIGEKYLLLNQWVATDGTLMYDVDYINSIIPTDVHTTPAFNFLSQDEYRISIINSIIDE